MPLEVTQLHRVRTVAAVKPTALTVALTPVEDGWWMAQILQVPAALSQGPTREEAVENVRDALQELLLAEAQDGAIGAQLVDVAGLDLQVA